MDQEPETYEATEVAVRAAFEAELALSETEGRPFSVLGFIAGCPDSGLREVSPGVYFGEGAWNTGSC